MHLLIQYIYPTSLTKKYCLNDIVGIDYNDSILLVADTVLMIKGKYFQYNNGYFELTGKRPGNQNLASVQQKIAQRLNQLINDNPNLELTELQERFVNEIAKSAYGKVNLKKTKIDICHHIAISAIMSAIVEIMNKTYNIKTGDIEKFADTIISSDSPNSRMKVKETFDDLQDKNIKPIDKILMVDTIVERLNRATPNLIPGYSATNRSIGKHKDPHLVLYDGKFTNTPRSLKISDAFGKLGFVYEPKSRVNPSGITEYQSSSISSKPKKAWSPDIFLSETSSSEESDTSYYSPSLSPSSSQDN